MGLKKQTRAGRRPGQIRRCLGSFFESAAHVSPFPTLRPKTNSARTFPALDQGISVETGGHGERTFRDQDLIVVSPGVPVDAPPLVQARALASPSSAKSNWPRTFSRAHRRHHRLERQDHHHRARRRNHDCRGFPGARRRQYRHARDLVGSSAPSRDSHNRAGDLQLSTRDH